MGRFDRTEESYIDQKIEENQLNLELAKVVKVFEHSAADDDSNHEVNVILRDEEKERRRVPIMNNTPGSIQVPKKGDTVIVGFLDGVSEAPVILGQVYNAKDRALLGAENMSRIKKGDLYFEVQSGEDENGNSVEWIRMAKKNSDDEYQQLPVTIEIDDTSAEDTVIKVKGNGPSSEMGAEFNFSTGEFKLGDGSGYGIVSDGNGNFTWYEKSVQFVEDGSTISW